MIIANTSQSNKNQRAIEQPQNNIMSIGQKGDIVEGIIQKNSDQVSIRFHDREVQVPTTSFSNAADGETRKFQIMDISKQNIVLREVGKLDSASAKIGNKILSQTGIQSTSIIIGKTIDAGKEQTEEEKANETAEKQKKQLDQISERMTSEDCRDLEEGGTSLTHTELEQLEQTLERMKEQKDLKLESIECQVEMQQEKKEDAENVTREDIIKKLKESNLPITESNINKVLNAMELMNSSNQLSNQGISYLIRNELTPTIENIYKATYSGNYTSYSGISNEAWEQLSNQVNSILTESGFTLNEENLACAKWLLDYELPVTTKTLEAYQQLNQLKEQTPEDRLEQIVLQIKDGIPVQQANLTTTPISSIKELLKNLQTISDGAIEQVTKEKKEVTVQNLLQAQQEQSENPMQREIKFPDIESITAKRQLEEIRLKMTIEAGRKLEQKGFHLETDKLEKVVEGLRELENSYYQNLLKDKGALDSIENIHLLKDTLTNAENLKQMPSYTLGATYSIKASQTIVSFNETGASIQASLEKAGLSYETMMTEPRSDLGDSIQKAFQNVDSILEEMNLEPTKANERAVRILGYNQIEITEETMQGIKAYDGLVQEVVDLLKPSYVVQLIKEGKNPLNMPLEQLDNTLLELDKMQGIPDEEKFSNYLWKLDREKGLTPEQRDSYIGIYRLLHQVQATNGAAIGAVYESGKELTLHNLLTEVRTSKTGGIDAQIDDQFGLLQSMKSKGTSITDQIDRAFSKTVPSQDAVQSTIEQTNQLLRQIMKEITPARLNEVNKTKDIINVSVENLEQSLEFAKDNIKVTNEYYEEQLEAVRTLSNSGEIKDILQFLAERAVEANLSTIDGAKQILYEKQPLFGKLKDVIKQSTKKEQSNHLQETAGELLDRLETPSIMQEQYSKLENQLVSLIEAEWTSGAVTLEVMNQYQSLRHGVQLATTLSKQQSYEIPLFIGEEVTNIHVTFAKESMKSNHININLDSNLLGQLNCDISVRENLITGFVLSNSRLGIDLLKSTETELEKKFSDMGFDLGTVDYVFNQAINKQYITHVKGNETIETGENGQKVSTNQLYQIAKAFIVAIKETEYNYKTEHIQTNERIGVIDEN